ncbi:MAG: WG repeat-containing protein [Clostridia bacterium]|nr:WG repeat-containing protein [Clostridia bacterium]
MSKHIFKMFVGLIFALFIALSFTALGEDRIFFADQNGVRYFAQDGLMGLMDSAGNVLVEPMLETATPFVDDLAVVSTNGQYGVLNRQGEFVVPCRWDELGRSQVTYHAWEDGLWERVVERPPLFWVEKDGKIGFLALDGQEICPPRWTSIFAFADGWAIVESEKGLNYINLVGHTLWAEDLPGARGHNFDKWFAQIYLEVLDGEASEPREVMNYADRQGRFLLKEPVEIGTDFTNDGVAAVKPIDGRWRLIDATGALIIEGDWAAVDVVVWQDSFFAFCSAFDGKWGLMDAAGRVLAEPIWDYITWAFSNKLVLIQREGKWGAMDTAGRVVAEPTWDYSMFGMPELGLGLGKEDETVGFIDTHDMIVMQSEEDAFSRFVEGLFVSEKDGKYGYVDYRGEWVVPPVWDEVRDFYEGLAPVCLDGLWGYIDATGEIRIPLQFPSQFFGPGMGDFVEGLAIITDHKTRTAYINQNGELVSAWVW